jgi:hypothetical protein
MPAPTFRFVCVPSALMGAPGNWARDMLRDGEIALLADAGGLDAINDVAHSLERISIAIIRGEPDAERQQSAVIAYAESLPLIWIGQTFGESATGWARDRGPMTLLIQAGGPLSDEERRRIDRFVATLGRQSE